MIDPARFLDHCRAQGVTFYTGVPDSLLKLIKAADRNAAYLESTRLAGFEEAEARKFFGPPPKYSAAMERDYLTPWPASTAAKRFAERIDKLLRA